MNARQAIADLDRELAATGTSVTLRRRLDTAGNFSDVVVKARVVFESADGIAGSSSKQRMGRVICSMTQIVQADWPGANANLLQVQRVPKAGDIARIDGADYTVESAAPVMMSFSVVRINMKVKG